MCVSHLETCLYLDEEYGTESKVLWSVSHDSHMRLFDIRNKTMVRGGREGVCEIGEEIVSHFFHEYYSYLVN